MQPHATQPSMGTPTGCIRSHAGRSEQSKLRDATCTTKTRFSLSRFTLSRFLVLDAAHITGTISHGDIFTQPVGFATCLNVCVAARCRAASQRRAPFILRKGCENHVFFTLQTRGARR
jgi:hypothetical protein